MYGVPTLTLCAGMPNAKLPAAYDVLTVALNVIPLTPGPMVTVKLTVVAPDTLTVCAGLSVTGPEPVKETEGVTVTVPVKPPFGVSKTE